MGGQLKEAFGEPQVVQAVMMDTWIPQSHLCRVNEPKAKSLFASCRRSTSFASTWLDDELTFPNLIRRLSIAVPFDPTGYRGNVATEMTHILMCRVGRDC